VSSNISHANNWQKKKEEEEEVQQHVAVEIMH